MGVGGRGIFEPQEFFSLSNSLYEFFFQAVAWIFFRVNWRAWIFINLILPCANIFFLYFARPLHKFSNGPSLNSIQGKNFFIHRQFIIGLQWTSIKSHLFKLRDRLLHFCLQRPNWKSSIFLYWFFFSFRWPWLFPWRRYLRSVSLEVD